MPNSPIKLYIKIIPKRYIIFKISTPKSKEKIAYFLRRFPTSVRKRKDQNLKEWTEQSP